MEMLPLSDVRKTKKPDETLGHAGYGKPTYTNLYLTTESHNCLERNQGVLKSLIIRVTEIKDEEKLTRFVKERAS